MPENNNGHLLSWKEAKELLGVSQATMWRIVEKRKELPIAKITYHGKQRHCFFKKADVEFLQLIRQPI